MAIKTLLELSVSQPGKKGSKLGHQVPAAEFVLETFGNSRTLFNPNASHFGKYTELQFTERGRICGRIICVSRWFVDPRRIFLWRTISRISVRNSTNGDL